MAVLVHGGDGGIAGAPGHAAVTGGQGQDLRHDVGLVALIEIEALRREPDGGGIVGIDLVGDLGLYVDVDLIVGGGAQAEGVVVEAHVGSPVGEAQAGVGGVVAPGVVGVGGADLEGGAGPGVAAQVVAVVGQGDAGAGGPDGGSGDVGDLDVGLAVGIAAAGRDGDGGSGEGVAPGAGGVAQDVTGAGGVGLGDHVILSGGQAVGQDVDSLLHMGVVVDLDGHGGFVARVVAGKDGHVAAGVGNGAGGVQGDGGRGSAGGLGLIDGLAVQGQDRHIGQVQVVGGGDAEGAAVQGGIGDDRSRVVHGEVIAHEGALAQDVLLQQGLELGVAQHAAVGGAVLVVEQHGVVLGDGVEAGPEALALVQPKAVHRLVGGVEAGARVLPGGLALIEPLAGDVAADDGGSQHVGDLMIAVQLGDCEAGGAGGADQVVEVVADGGIRAQGQTLGGEFVLNHVGVAGELGGRALVGHGHVVGVGSAGVGHAGLTVESVHVGHGVEHGGIGPGAVEAQKGDGVGHVQQLAVPGLGDAVDEGEAFHVSAGGIVGVHGGGVGGDPDGDSDGLGAVGRDDQIAGSSGLPVQKEVGVPGGDAAVLVQVGCAQVQIGGVGVAGQIGQDGVGVQGIGSTVQVDVVGLGLRAIPGVGGGPAVGSQIRGGVVHVGVAVLVLVAVLGEELGVQLVSQSRVAQVVDLKAVAVGAGPLGLVAQLGLDLAVGVRDRGVLAHEDGGGGVDGLMHVGKTGALLQDGIVGALGAADVHGLGGGHQQALDELTVGVTRDADVVLGQVLGQHGGEAGDVRRGHGGAGHGLILVGAAGSSAGAGLVGAEDRVDVAAGGGDLGLHDQGAGSAPGGELGDLGVVAHLAVLHGRGDGDAAGVVGVAAGGGGGGGGLDLLRGVQGDGDHGEAAGEVVQAHVDGAGLVVGDQQGLGIVALGVFALLHKAQIAAVDDDDLAAQGDGGVDRGVIGGLADGVDVDEVPGAGDGRQLGTAGAPGIGLGIEHVLAVIDQGGAGGAGVLGSGDAEAVEEGAGAAAGVHVDVVDVEVGLQIIGKGAGVARRDGDHQLGVLGPVGEPVQHVLIGVGNGEAGGGGAKGQVADVHAHGQAVLDGSHVVGVSGAAALAEDLHDEDLGVGGHAHGVDRGGCVVVGAAALDEAVGGGDAGHVGAVLAGGVLHVAQVHQGVGLVHVVVAEGDLGGDVAAGAVQGQTAVAGGGHQVHGLAGLLDGVVEGVGVEALVQIVHAGVDDGHGVARAGVALGPGRRGAHHVVGGVGGVGLGHVAVGLVNGGLVAVLHEDVLDAGNGLDGLQVAVAELGGDQVHCQGQVPLDVQALAQGGLDAGLNGVLPGPELVPVGVSRGVGAHAVGGVAVQGGLTVQDDGHTDQIRQRVGRLLHGRGGLFLERAKLGDVQGRGVDGRQLRFLRAVALFCGLGRGNRGNQQGDEHGDGQQDREKSAAEMCLLHADSPFLKNMAKIIIQHLEKKNIFLF